MSILRSVKMSENEAVLKELLLSLDHINCDLLDRIVAGFGLSPYVDLMERYSDNVFYLAKGYGFDTWVAYIYRTGFIEVLTCE